MGFTLFNFQVELIIMLQIYDILYCFVFVSLIQNITIIFYFMFMST